MSKLGAGGMAVVYKAEDTVLGRCVALKTLHERYAEEESFRRRFKQEARLMASLDHENVVKVYDISQEGEAPFIVAEYVGGRDVGSMLKKAPGDRLGWRFTIEIVEQLLIALDYAHRRGVIHRDIKPSNILVTGEGVVKVADFGIARAVEDEEAGRTGEIVGSARYMSPEQLRGEKTTPRSDLYSVGILLYHCLTGRPPFSGDTRSVASQQIRNTPTPPCKLNKEIPPALEAVVLKALAKDPQDRHPSALAMLKDLHAQSSAYPAAGGYVETTRRRPFRAREALLVLSVLALLFVGAGTATAGLGYANLDDLKMPWRSGSASTPSSSSADSSGATPGAQQGATAQTADAEQASATTVPNVDAYFDYYAENVLKNSGFKTRIVYEYHQGYAPAGVTWATDPAAGSHAPAGSTVIIYATPKDQPQVPQVILQQPPSQGEATR